jgi:hypothetical protein
MWHTFLQCPLWGWPDIDIYSSFPIDRLHQDHNGVTQRLQESLQDLLANRPSRVGTPAAVLQSINDRLTAMSSCHLARIPEHGLASIKLDAEDRKGIMMFLGIAMYGLVDDAVAELYAGM